MNWMRHALIRKKHESTTRGTVVCGPINDYCPFPDISAVMFLHFTCLSNLIRGLPVPPSDILDLLPLARDHDDSIDDASC